MLFGAAFLQQRLQFVVNSGNDNEDEIH